MFLILFALSSSSPIRGVVHTANGNKCIGSPASCAIKRAFVLMIDNRYHVVGAELEHVQHQILPL